MAPLLDNLRAFCQVPSKLLQYSVRAFDGTTLSLPHGYNQTREMKTCWEDQKREQNKLGNRSTGVILIRHQAVPLYGHCYSNSFVTFCSQLSKSWPRRLILLPRPLEQPTQRPQSRQPPGARQSQSAGSYNYLPPRVGNWPGSSIRGAETRRALLNAPPAAPPLKAPRSPSAARPRPRPRPRAPLFP